MKELLHKLVRRESLASHEARAAFDAMMSGQVDPLLVGAFLTALATKGPSVDEVVAAATVMREHSTKVTLPDDDRPTLDTCGTGGDVKGTFNISTAAAIVAAGCGVRVVKHGNRSASSKSGSADVLEALGVKLDVTPDVASRCVNDVGLCFAFARNHHPAMKHVAPVRQLLGIPTLFNLLGPLTNPGGATFQLLGAYSLDVARLLASALHQLGTTRAWVVHGHDGLDELTIATTSTVVEVTPDGLREFTIDPTSLGIPRQSVDALRVDGPNQSAEVIRSVFAGASGPASDIVALNAGAALVVAGHCTTLMEALSEARHSIRSGHAAETLEALTRLTLS